MTVFQPLAFYVIQFRKIMLYAIQYERATSYIQPCNKGKNLVIYTHDFCKFFIIVVLLYHITNKINKTIHSEIQIIISHVYSNSPVTLFMLQITPSWCNWVTLFTRDDPINLIKIRGDRCSDPVELRWTDNKQCMRLASGQVLKPQFMQSLIHTQSIALITILISSVLTWCSNSPFFVIQ